MDTRKKLYEKIIISGANTLFPGFSSRLEAEIVSLYKQRVLKDVNGRMKIAMEIIDSPRRNYSVFIGATIIAKVYENMEEYWISKQEWDEVGPNILNQKCQNMLG
jgi:actin-related protein